MTVLSYLHFCVVFALTIHLQTAVQTVDISDNFLWGVATAAYQIEGAVNDGGRGQTIWDSFSALPGKIHNGDTGEVADDSYHRMKEDVQIIKDMGLKSYRFSIAWSRIMPTGEMPTNQAGIDQYNMLLDELQRQGIEPLVTLYHWDLPLALEEKYEGWLSPKIEDAFATYADVCFAAFGDRVKMWTTINEPWTFCTMGYVSGAFAPGRCSNREKCALGNSSTEGYIAAHNVLNAHAAAVDIYRKHYQTDQGGRIGIVLNQDWAEPLTDDPLDVIAASRKNEFTMGWFADPIVFGRYPESMVALVGDRLPHFTAQQKERLIGSYDYFAFNHYTSKYYYDPLRALKQGEIRVSPVTASNTSHTGRALFNAVSNTGWAADQLNSESKYDVKGDLIGQEAASAWLHVVPWGFYKVIMWNHYRYTVNGKHPTIYITENGVDVAFETEMSIERALDDTFRVDYYRSYLQEMDRAIKDGVDIRGYYAWSLLDNFEWIDGYSNRFGLVYIDYKNASLPRYPKKSSRWYAEYAGAHKYDMPSHISADGGFYYDDGAETAGVISIGGGDKNKKDKKSKKSYKKDKKKKNKRKKSADDDSETGLLIPSDDDYTVNPDSQLYNNHISSRLWREQRKRMEEVVTRGGWVDFLHAAMGSNHGASTFGPQGVVAC